MRRTTTNTACDMGLHWPAEFVNEVERAQTSHLPDPRYLRKPFSEPARVPSSERVPGFQLRAMSRSAAT